MFLVCTHKKADFAYKRSITKFQSRRYRCIPYNNTYTRGFFFSTSSFFNIFFFYFASQTFLLGFLPPPSPPCLLRSIGVGCRNTHVRTVRTLTCVVQPFFWRNTRVLCVHFMRGPAGEFVGFFFFSITRVPAA